LPIRTNESSQAKDTAAGITVAASSSVRPKIISSNSLEPNLLAIKSVDIFAPFAFTTTEYGQINIFDMKNSKPMKSLDLKCPIYWLHISTGTPKKVLDTLESDDYLQHLKIITGGLDAHIRHYALKNGMFEHTVNCRSVLTCVAGSKKSTEILYIGSRTGNILKYSPQTKK
jgi:hypothetical protein